MSSKKPQKAASKAVAGAQGAKLKFEVERGQFRHLIAQNANYFGTLKGSTLKPVLNIAGDTTYEQISCVGYEPHFNRLEAVVFIKQQTGYSGGICSPGSQEYVRFYLSFDNGASWQDQGMVSFTAFDVPGEKPLEYDVTLTINPPRKFCFIDNIPKVRAILSWNNPPPASAPDFSPVWGNVVDVHIQINGLIFFELGEVFKLSKAQPAPEIAKLVDLSHPVPAAKPEPLSALLLHQLYKDTKVPQHRYLFNEIQQFVSKPLAAATAVSPGLTGLSQALKIDLGNVVGKVIATDGDTSFEELTCVGLNPNEAKLVGVIKVKLPNGYSGGPCSAGSQEYVAFWVDWGEGGGFTYVGTTSVTVHDIAAIPPDGLQYSVVLPVPDIFSHTQPCDLGPKTARVRAILSWNTPPPTNNPNFKPVWGNHDDTLILIPPGPLVKGGAQVPFLSSVGTMPESLIGTNGLANGPGIHGFGAVDSPFGGRIDISGHISNPTSAKRYRVVKKPHGAPDSAYVPITNEPTGLPLTINTFDGVSWHQTTTVFHADVNGYYPFQDYSPNHSVEDSVMAIWYSNIAEDGQLFDLRIDLNVDGNPAHDAHSNVVTLLIDNIAPVALLDIDLTGGPCADFHTGDKFTGHYTATDLHFGSFSFVIRPPGPAHGALPIPASRSYTGAGDTGDNNKQYKLDTAGMDPCGYSLTLQVSDRTCADNGARHNYNEASVGFCLRKP